MPSDPLLTAALTGGAAIAGSAVTGILNYYATKSQMREENELRHAEYFLSRKVETLSDLHTSLTTCSTTVVSAFQSPEDYDWERVQAELVPEIESLERSVSMSSIFLSDDQEYVLRKTLDQFWDKSYDVALHDSKSPAVVDELVEQTQEAKEVLAEEINEPIKRVEPNYERASRVRYSANDIPRESMESRVLAEQKAKISRALSIRDDGEVTIDEDVRIGIDGSLLLRLIGQRYAYEAQKIDSPAVSKGKIVQWANGSEPTANIFLGKAEDFIEETRSGEYAVRTDNVPAAIEWCLD